MKNIIVIFLLIHVNVFAQEKAQLDRKYLTALIYLKTNVDIKDQILTFQKKWTKSKKKDIMADDNFNLSKYVAYLPIPSSNQNYSAPTFLSRDSKLLENKFFETIEIKTFNKLVPVNKSKFCLFYSKPIGNYLIAEMLLLSSGNEIDQLSHKQGPAMSIMFVFDEDDIVQKVYISHSYYN